MKIYLDTCCWGRKQDNHSVPRNAAEAVAVDGVIGLCRIAGGIIVGSSVVEAEIMKNPDAEGRGADIKLFAESIGSYEDLTDSDTVRALVFQAAGLKVRDSHHLAIAERVGADVLITVDDNFERVATGKQLSDVRVTNPLNFLMEVFR